MWKFSLAWVLLGACCFGQTLATPPSGTKVELPQCYTDFVPDTRIINELTILRVEVEDLSYHLNSVNQELAKLTKKPHHRKIVNVLLITERVVTGCRLCLCRQRLKARG